ncbi:uncharacterized protein LOC144356303, partial [Saccoglossus kowalevskii]
LEQIPASITNGVPNVNNPAEDLISNSQSSDSDETRQSDRLSILQNGKLPQFMDTALLDELFISSEPSECVLHLRKGLAKQGIYQLCCQIPTFRHLLQPRQMKGLLKPNYTGEEGSNVRMYENSIYAVFLDYIREIA